ncbi:MAG TPA: L-seryl-tRNA(Sec) selenium transferase [Pyrinomonadaceae bacterium]|nr:L-seryl-tRNA(Sec) selenium transferase [Pyrinomonadaceae bacterium]
MTSSEAVERTAILRQLPSIDELLRSATAKDLVGETGPTRLTDLARNVIGDLRSELSEPNPDDNGDHTKATFLANAESRLANKWIAEKSSGLSRVINATGVVIHTNLGRAPLSESAKRAIVETAAGYCTLEYDVKTGKRGQRGSRAEKLLCELTGAEAAVIVNNCAAAAFLVLTVLASGGEVVISRGELVEIGGDFRVPDVLAQSGSILKEVGTTNRTKLADYDKAISDATRLILRVHPSNYRIVGFTATPATAELAALAHERGILFYEDAGSGALFDLSGFGLADEPVIGDSIKAGVDVVTFSGDKLLGGPQSGLIVGHREIVEKIRKHPLYRALRVDKMTYAALEATLEAYRRQTAIDEVPVLKMLSATGEQMRERTKRFARSLSDKLGGSALLKFEMIEGNSVVGGGSAPMAHPQTSLVALTHEKLSADELEMQLRRSDPPVIARVLNDRVVLDLRTVFDGEEDRLTEALVKI